MAVTQYIGARYVPLFAQPLEWNNKITYEPLTIVLHNGSSYTSRQFVPTGIDISDENFWALTGNYNAQVEQYRNEVNKYKADVNNFDSRITKAQTDASNALLPRPTTRKVKAVIIGDSFTDPNYEGEGHKKWWEWLQDTGWECHVFAAKGSGFVQPSNDETGNKTFMTCVNEAIADDSFDHNSIDRVIIYGGANDIFNHWSSEPTEISIANAMNACANALTNSFPYADVTIYYGNTGQAWEITNDNVGLLSQPLLIFPRLNQKVKIVCATQWLGGYFRNSNLCEAGYIHPNEEGHKLIANIIGTGTQYPTRSNSGDCFGPATTDNDNITVSIKGRMNCSGNGANLIYGMNFEMDISATQTIAEGTIINVKVPITEAGFHLFGVPIQFNDYAASKIALRFMKATNKELTFNVYALKEWNSGFKYLSAYTDTKSVNIVGF